MNILYIHGFASSGSNSSKVKTINKIYPEANIFAPDLKHDLVQDVQFLKEILVYLDVDIIIGSSMGGYLATILATEFNVPTLLINPLVDTQYLLDKAGARYRNYSTGKDFYFSNANYNTDVLTNDNGRNGRYSSDVNDINKITVALGTEDKELDHTLALDKYKQCTILKYEDDHRFSKSFLPALLKFQQQCEVNKLYN